MKDMTRDEIISFIKEWTWGTLIAVDGEGPYAVEVSYGTDGEYIYCGTKPGGKMYECVNANQNVAFKVCDSDRSCSKWNAVIIQGKAERLTKIDDIRYSHRCIVKSMGLRKGAFDHMAEEVAANPESNSLRIPLKNISGKRIG